MFQTLRDSLKRYPTQPKLLVCATQRAGRLICQRLAREHGGIINLRAVTIARLAGEIAARDRIRQGLRLASETEGQLLVQQLLPETRYYREARHLPGLARALWRAVSELRRFEITPDQIRSAPFPQVDRRNDLAFLLETLPQKLTEAGHLDSAELLRLAINSARATPLAAVLFVPADLSLNPLEQKFLDAITPTTRIDLPTHLADSTASQSLPASWRAVMTPPLHPVARLIDTTASPAPKPDETAQTIDLFVGVSPTAELTEVIRRIRAEERPLEEIEISLGLPHEQAPLLTTLCETHRVPYAIAFAQPAKLFRAGRFAISLASWVERDFPAAELLAMLEQGDLNLFGRFRRSSASTAPRTPSPSACISMIRRSHALGGRDGYDLPFQAFALEQKNRGQHGFAADIEQLLARIKRLIATFPEEATLAEHARKLEQTFARLFRVTGPTDGLLARKIRLHLRSLNDSIDVSMTRGDAMVWISRSVAELTYQVPLDAAGKVLITGPGTRGWSGRPRLYLTGQTHDAVHGRATGDPVLPNDLRHDLKPLLTDADRRRERLAAYQAFLGRLPATTRLTLSVSSFDLAWRSISPAVPFLHLLTALFGDRGRDWEKLRGSQDLPLCTDTACRTDETVSDMRRLLTRSDFLLTTISDARQSVQARISAAYSLIPSYRRHLESATERQINGVDLSTHRDWKPEYMSFTTPHRPLSASGIEGLGGCSYRLLLRYLFKCMPSEKPVAGVEIKPFWLDHFQRGNLLHEVFELFLRTSAWPVTDADLPLLEKVFDDVLQRWKAAVPPSDPTLFEREARELHDDVRFFFDHQKAGGPRKGRPVGFEVAFGMPLTSPEGDRLGLSTEAPVPYALTQNITFYLQGRIDRLEADDQNRLWVIDYKTGQSETYVTGEGTERADLQKALYAVVVDLLLRQKGLQNYSVAGAGLYFPTVRGKGEFLEASIEYAKRYLEDALVGTIDAVNSGEFGGDPSDCQTCNMQTICPFLSHASIPTISNCQAKEG